MSKTAYECPRCEKGLVTEDEPPGIIHKCDDCVERMVPVGEGDETTATSSTGKEQ